MFTKPQQDIHIEKWPGLEEIQAWGQLLPRQAITPEVWKTTVGQGPRRVLVVAYPAGHQPVGAAALPGLVSRLQEDHAGCAWDIVPYTCPAAMALNAGALSTEFDMVSTTPTICRTARGDRFDADPAHSVLSPLWEDRYDLCIVLRNRYFGSASVLAADDLPGEIVRPILVEHALPYEARDIFWQTDRPPSLETWLWRTFRTRTVTLMLPRFTHPDGMKDTLTQTTQEELRQLLLQKGRQGLDRWTDWYDQLRPFLTHGSTLRAGLDQWAEEHAAALQSLATLRVMAAAATHAQVASSLGHGEVELLLATGQLLRLVREEIRQGHTVPALMAGVRPLTAALQSAASLGEQTTEVSPARAARIVIEAILALAHKLP